MMDTPYKLSNVQAVKLQDACRHKLGLVISTLIYNSSIVTVDFGYGARGVPLFAGAANLEVDAEVSTRYLVLL